MLPNELKALCQANNIRPSKAYGQNFLIDGNIIKKIIAVSDIKKKELILEVGPGLGVLTEELLAKAGQVWAVEADKKIVQILQQRLKKEIHSGKLKLIEGDILKTNLPELGLKDFSFRIICNLPYSITSKFFRQFLEFGPKPQEMIVMIQKEVAKRMVALPGEMSLLALSAQLFSEPEILFEVAPTCFWPEPEVVSAVIRLKLKKKLPDADIKLLFRLARFGFASKRKQLHNNLANGLKKTSEEIKGALKQLGLSENIRAQDLSLENWIALAKKLG